MEQGEWYADWLSKKIYKSYEVAEIILNLVRNKY